MTHSDSFGIDLAARKRHCGRNFVALGVLGLVFFHTDFAACYQKSYRGGRDRGVFITVSTLYAENGLGRSPAGWHTS